MGLGVVTSSRKFKKEEDQTDFHNTRTKLSEQDEWEFPHPPLWEWAVGEGRGQDRKSIKIPPLVESSPRPPPPVGVGVGVGDFVCASAGSSAHSFGLTAAVVG